MVSDELNGTFHSLLFRGSNDVPLETRQPSCFVDLNLDQIVSAITAGVEEHRLEEIFYTPLRDAEQIAYRQEICRDLMKPSVHHHARALIDALAFQRDTLAHLPAHAIERQQHLWTLEAILTYQSAVRELSQALHEDDLESAGMRGFRTWLSDYVAGADFEEQSQHALALRERCDAITFTMLIDGLTVTISPYENETDYSAEVEATFARFVQDDDVKSHLTRFSSSLWLDTVEENTLECVAQLYPELFGDLQSYVQANVSTYFSPVVAGVERALQFYLRYLEHTDRIADTGLSFTLPRMSTSKASGVDNVFDLALADKRVAQGAQVITNSFQLNDPERVIVITGANQGGKTTFSRTFGQVHWLGRLGIPVAGSRADLFISDAIFTHYEKQEDIMTLHGKLEDELVRIHDILASATSNSIIIMNEIFNSTTLDDAIVLGTAVLREIIDRDILALCVTFVDELTRLSDTTVSFVALVDPAQPGARTFIIERQQADGRAYALALAEKYGLTHDRITARIAA